MRAYYEARAPEYDDWWLGAGAFATRERPGWEDELSALTAALGALAPVHTLDVACGTGFLSAHLPGELTCLDQSPAMLAIAAERLPHARLVRSEAIPIPFADGTFGRVFTSHFYGHLEEPQRLSFVREARRVAPELVVVDSALRDDVEPVEWQERVLRDGSRWRVYKRYFAPEELVAELGGGAIVHAGRWFVAVRA